MNRLDKQTSPYLLQHADNPVHWHPWDDEALALARKEKKPILLSIGYSSCHWCHVMAHETFENKAIAKLMNDNYINIKVGALDDPTRLVMGNFSANTNNLGSQFDGHIYDLQIYDETLSSAEISFLANNAGLAIPEPAVVGFVGLGVAVLAMVRRCSCR